MVGLPGRFFAKRGESPRCPHARTFGGLTSTGAGKQEVSGMMKHRVAEKEAMHWGERLATWISSLSPATQELILRVLAAMPGGEVLKDYGIDEDALLGGVEGMILANYMRAVLHSDIRVHEEVIKRFFLDEEGEEEEEE